jgi:hypothetical protein
LKKILFILAGALLLLGTVNLTKYISQRKIIARLIEKDAGAIKELRYRLFIFGLIPVGEAVITQGGQESYQGQKVYRLSAQARTGRLVSVFFSAQAETESLVETAGLNPLLFRQRIAVKNKNEILKEVRYDQKQGIMTLGQESRIIPIGTKDPLSALAYLERLDLDAEKDVQLYINTNQKTYVFKGTSESKKILLKQKAFYLARLNAHISRRDKNPYHKSSISIVLLRLDKNIPLKINVFASGFLLEALLREVK